MLNHYPDYITEAIQADIISETANGTYLGWFDRTHLDRSEGAAAIDTGRKMKGALGKFGKGLKMI